MTQTPDLPRHVAEAVHTAVSELPSGTHIDDYADCVCGMIPRADFDAHHDAIYHMIDMIR
jgi:hypothetical protein